jgi:hypothetical protein
MLCIPGRGHSVPTVTELIFVRAQCFTNFPITAIYALRTITGSSYSCESAVFYQLSYESNLHFADNNWIFTNFPIKAIYASWTITGSSYCPQSVNCCNRKVGKTLRSHKNQFGDRGNPMTPDQDAQHLLVSRICGRWLENPVSNCPCISRREVFDKREDTVSYPVNGQDSNPRSELTFVRAQCFTNFSIKTIHALRTITGSSYCPQSVNLL